MLSKIQIVPVSLLALSLLGLNLFPGNVKAQEAAAFVGVQLESGLNADSFDPNAIEAIAISVAIGSGGAEAIGDIDIDGSIETLAIGSANTNIGSFIVSPDGNNMNINSIDNEMSATIGAIEMFNTPQ
ncbi:MAG: hypothetical protein AAGA75_28460 [Cyanobacteria bacterium P01_E01_bin.6]